MSNQHPKCIHCERDSYEVPLITIQYQDSETWICPQHLPILIHKPQTLVGKLPGAENLVSKDHNHH